MDDLEALALERLGSQLRWPISELNDCIQNMYESESVYARRLVVTEAAISYIQAPDLAEALQKDQNLAMAMRGAGGHIVILPGT